MVVPALYGWVLVLCAGCAEPTPPATSSEFPGIAASVIESPATLVLGLGGDGRGHYFERITNVGLVGDSLIVVVDSGALRVGVYGLDGAFRRWLTGKGEGPGEVRHIGESGIGRDGTVWVLDRINPDPGHVRGAGPRRHHHAAMEGGRRGAPVDGPRALCETESDRSPVTEAPLHDDRG